jgi:hypothetical protein
LQVPKGVFLRHQFSALSSSRIDAERFLRGEKIPYDVLPDGMLRVKGSIDLHNRDLADLPDLSAVIVEGYFSCSGNRLENLKGAPREVGGDFFCRDNRLTSLEGAPRRVANLHCTGNRLQTLAHAPEVDCALICTDNPLIYLEGAPQGFSRLKSDLGSFRYWEEIPEDLRLSPATRARLEQERLAAAEREIRKATELDQDLAVRKPFRFQKPGP